VQDEAPRRSDPTGPAPEGRRRRLPVAAGSVLVLAVLAVVLVVSDVLSWEEPVELAAGEYPALSGDATAPLRVGLRGATVDEVPWERSVSWWTPGVLRRRTRRPGARQGPGADWSGMPSRRRRSVSSAAITRSASPRSASRTSVPSRRSAWMPFGQDPTRKPRISSQGTVG
jgi:hypothetical protein